MAQPNSYIYSRDIDCVSLTKVQCRTDEIHARIRHSLTSIFLAHFRIHSSRLGRSIANPPERDCYLHPAINLTYSLLAFHYAYYRNCRSCQFRCCHHVPCRRPEQQRTYHLRTNYVRCVAKPRMSCTKKHHCDLLS